MNTPILIDASSFQRAWVDVVAMLQSNHWELWDVVARIDNPMLIDQTFDKKVKEHADKIGILTPRKVSYTIFPDTYAKQKKNYYELRDSYIKRLYPKLMKKERSGWGTYFQRMVNYETVLNGEIVYVDQLGKIIESMGKNKNVHRAAYTVNISRPGSDNIKLRGAPCLNTLAFREESVGKDSKRLSLTAFYRNHDFLERAYGNYKGLCNLLIYLASQTHAEVGTLTCISSHAEVTRYKRLLRNFIEKEEPII